MSETKHGNVRQALRWIYGFIRPHRVWLFASVAANIVLAALDMVRIYSVKELIDKALAGHTHSLPLVVIVLGAAVLIGFAGHYVVRYSNKRLAALVTNDLNRALGEHISDIPVSCLDDRHSGDLISRSCYEVKGIVGFISDSFHHVIILPLTFVAATVYMLTIDWRLLLVSLILVPPAMYASTRLSERLTGITKEGLTGRGETSAVVQDTVSGITTVKAFGLERTRAEKLWERSSGVRDADTRYARYLAWAVTPFRVLMAESPRILCMLYGGYLTIQRMFPSPERVKTL